MTTESERLIHFARELSSRLGGAVQDMVPPEAQRHLLNAQRELLTAFFLIYEHQAAGRRDTAAPKRRTRTSTRRPKPRVSKIDIE
ncbi:MAG TPA: hypothetical protein VF134_07820 [Candidatus Dormibacteraeota bacterium]